LTALPPAKLTAPFVFIPVLSFSEDLTDNVNVSSTDRDFDSISTLALSYQIAIQTRHSLFRGSGVLQYQKYLSTTEFDSFGVSGVGIGQVELVNRFLFADARYSTGVLFISPSVTPATSRGTAIPQVRFTTYDASPYLTTTVADFLDVLLRARRAVVRFDDFGNTPSPIGTERTTIDQGIGRISTGLHIPKYEMIVSGEYLEQHDGLRLYNGIYSLYWGRATGTRLIARVGYENISDPGITDLQGLIWSAGITWSPEPLSRIHVEYGHRYDKPTWNGDAIYSLSGAIFVTASYNRNLESLQSRLRRTLPSITDQPTDSPIGIPVLPTPILAELVNGTALTDAFGFGMAWLIDPPAAQNPLRDLSSARHTPLNVSGFVSPSLGTSITIEGGSSRSRVVAANVESISQSITIRFLRAATRKLGFITTLGFGHNQTILPAPGQSDIYRCQIGASYLLTRTSTAEAAYTWQSRASGGGGRTTENVIGIVLRHTL
jgi:uncharacterized protein (PEP-CTERM system associated)